MSRGSTPWRALARLVRPEVVRYGLLSVAILVATAPSVAAPLVVRRIIDDAVGDITAAGSGGGRGTGPAGDAVDRIRTLGLVLLALAVASQLLRVFVTWLATTTAWHTANDLRVRLTGHVLGLDHEFHRANTPGALVQRIDGDVTSVSDFLGRVVVTVGSGVLMLVGTLGAVLIIDWRLGLGAVAYVAVVGLVLAMMRDEAVAEAEGAMSAKARLYGGIEERLTAAEDLRANGAGAHAMARFVAEANDHLDARLTEERAFLRMWAVLQMSVATGLALSIAVGGWLVARGSITAGTAFLLFQYVLWLRRPIGEIIDQLEMVQKASGAMTRVDKLLALRPAVVDGGTTSPAPGPLSVTFEGVGFGYEADDAALVLESVDGDEDGDGAGGTEGPVLVDVDLAIAAGRSVGVVGRSGSGKTTLSRLVLRLIEATSGRLLLGGVPIADIPLAELRRRVALIPQEVQLIRGTIRDNVTMFDPAPLGWTDDGDSTATGVDSGDHDSSDGGDGDPVRAALEAVGLDLDPDAVLGTDVGLSAGQAQLLALARVWLRRPDLVVLDEATARVDPATEADLQVAIQRLLAGRTALIIAHRLSTLATVDEIVVVDHGRILEHGNRAELEADPSGRYRRLLELALEDDQTPDENSDGPGGDARSMSEVAS